MIILLPICSRGKITYNLTGRWKWVRGNWTRINPPPPQVTRFNHCPPACPPGTRRMLVNFLNDTFSLPPKRIQQTLLKMIKIDVTVTADVEVEIRKFECRKSKPKPKSPKYFSVMKKRGKKVRLKRVVRKKRT
jgi:hypothetical protein